MTEDELYDQAKTLVAELQQVSVSILQRRLKIGVLTAVRLIDQLEISGVISKPSLGFVCSVLVCPHGQAWDDCPDCRH